MRPGERSIEETGRVQVIVVKFAAGSSYAIYRYTSRCDVQILLMV